MKRGKELKKRFSKINEFLEIPEEVITDKPKITILGFEELVIENYKNILEYEEVFIKVNTYIGAININGFNLKLIQMNAEDLMITGTIDSIDFEANGQVKNLIFKIIINYILGYVNISVEGYYIERFINICISKGILLWNVKREKSTFMIANVRKK